MNLQNKFYKEKEINWLWVSKHNALDKDFIKVFQDKIYKRI